MSGCVGFGLERTTLALYRRHGFNRAAWPEPTREALVALVHQWRANALQALTAEDWKASVDTYLEVAVDARMYLLSQGKL
jgi:hypothetical protein